MNNLIRIKRGLDLKLNGHAEKNEVGEIESKFYSLRPIDFESFTPKLILKQGNHVKRGETVFVNKYNPLVCFPSPVSGRIHEVVRGEKRKVMEIIIESDEKDEFIKHDTTGILDFKNDRKIEILQKSGLWAYIIQRPYGIIANPDDKPRDIFISFFDSSPLAPDYDFILKDKKEEINLALKLLKSFTDGDIYLGFRPGQETEKLIENVSDYKKHYFKGPHPAGLVGVQINQLKPINKGEIIWTVDAADLPILGYFVKTGEYLPERLIAFSGSEITKPAYYKSRSGVSLSETIKNITLNSHVRIISGNVLTGKNVTTSPYLSFYSKQVCVIPEGSNKFEFMGWAMPGFNKLSASGTFMSRIFLGKSFIPDTRLHGGHRAYVVTGQYEAVCPMDIYPQLLVKAIMVNDIDKMEQLGIYEVIEEDMALCEFVCASKIEVQEIIRKGIDEMIKEMS